MADEYTLYWLGAEVVEANESEGVIYHLTAEVIYSVVSDARIDWLGAEVVSTPWHKSNLTLLDDTDDASDALTLVYYVDVILPDGLDDTLDSVLDPTASFGLIEEPAIPIEWNPYRPDVPLDLATTDPESYDFQREQAETLRDQHNLTQAGATTFPWQLMVKLTNTEEYTLGSLTRFFHEDYGIIWARYVKFSDNWLGTIHGPVYHDMSIGAEWVVTDDVTESHWSRLTGVSLPVESQLAGLYGWVQVHGRGVFEIQVENDTQPALNDVFTQGQTAGFYGQGVGKKLGQIVDVSWLREALLDSVSYDPKRWRLSAGTWVLDLEGVTPAYIVDAVSGELQTITGRLDELESVPEVVLPDYTLIFDAYDASIAGLTNGLTLETNTRYNSDNALRARIVTLEGLVTGGGVGITASEFYALDARVTSIEEIQVPRIDGLETRMTAAENEVSSLGGRVTTNEAAINALTGLFGAFPTASGLIELIQDTTDELLVGGTGIALTYDDVSDPRTLTIDVNPVELAETIDDRVNALLVAGTNITLTYDDGADTLTIAAAGGGGGGTTLAIDGGDASNSGTPDIAIDGGSA